jgi:hypothetical protein
MTPSGGSRVTKSVELENLKGMVQNVERFRAFEREMLEAIDREADDRRFKVEDEKRTKEKKARKKRLKKQAQAQG